MSDQSDDDEQFNNFLAFLSPTSNSNNVDSSSNVDGATAEDITESSLGSSIKTAAAKRFVSSCFLFYTRKTQLVTHAW